MKAAWKKIGSLPKENRTLFWAVLTQRSGTMVMPFLVLYLTKVLHMSLIEISQFYVGLGVGSVLAVLGFGKLCDLLSPLKIMKLTLGLTVIFLFAVPFVHTKLYVLLLLFGFTLVSEGFRPASMTYLAHINHATSLKIASSFYRLAINLGMSVGPMIGGFVFDWKPIGMFWLNGIMDLAALLWLLQINRDPQATTNADHTFTQEPASPESESDFNSKASNKIPLFSFTTYLLCCIGFGLAFAQTNSSLALFIDQHLGLSAKYFGFLTTVNTALIVLFEVWLNDKMTGVKDSRQVQLGIVLVCFGMAATFWAPTYGWIVLLTSVWTVGEMVLYPASTSFTLSYANKYNRGLIMGLFTATFSLCNAIGPAMGAKLYEMDGAHAIAWFCAALGVGSMAFLSLSLRTRHQHGKS